MITHYEYTDPDPDNWRNEPIELGKINLIVGASSSGKTRFLNTIFNFGLTVSKGEPFRSGTWKMTVVVGEYEYRWEYIGASETPNAIKYELLTRKKAGEDRATLIERSNDALKFNGNLLPKLNRSAPSVTILKEEPTIAPLYKLFSHMKFQRFDKNPLSKAVIPQIFDPAILQQLQTEPDLEKILALQFTIASNLHYLKDYFPDRYDFAIRFFKDYFPTVKDIKIELFNENIPKLYIREKGVKDLIPLELLSSGMQKALLIISDIISLPSGCTYMMDEYENLLGVNVIDFLPKLLAEYGGDNQFLITTHHPYLINNMPMKNWLVFNRKGSTIRSRIGRDLEQKYGKSKQKAFIQLVNDPFYTGVS